MVNSHAVDLTVSSEGIRALANALRREENGTQLRKELARNMRQALRPAVMEAKGGILSMPAAGGTRPPALRTAIARKIRAEVKLGGMWTGARVKAGKTPNVRNFKNAPKRTNRPSGWRHPLFGNNDRWYTQHGKIDWFDEPMQQHKAEYKRAVFDAMEEMAERIANNSHL